VRYRSASLAGRRIGLSLMSSGHPWARILPASKPHGAAPREIHTNVTNVRSWQESDMPPLACRVNTSGGRARRIRMKKLYKAALAVVMVVVLGLTTAGFAEARGGGQGGGGGGFHGGGGSGFHGGGGFHGGFQGHPGFHGHSGFHHGFHGHGFVGVAPFYWWGPGYAYAPYDPATPGYWYYCPSAQAYYPYVQTCPESWVPVPAS
jgi:hypothetical protein